MFFLCQFVVAQKKMPYLLLWLSRVAADSKTSRFLRRHSGAASLIITLFVLCFICFVFFVYLVASINKLELKGYTKEFRGGIEQERDAQEVQTGLESGLMGICREKGGLTLLWMERKPS